MQQKPTSAISKGIIISLLLIVFSLVLYFMDLQNQPGLQYIGYAIFIVGIIWSISSYAKQIDYNATFGKYFLHGFSIAAIVTCVMIIFMVIFLLVDPSLKQEALDKTAEEMAKNPKLTPEQAKQALQITGKFFTPILLGGILLGYMFFGTIVALVTAAVIKKNPRSIYEDDDFDNIKPIA